MKYYNAVEDKDVQAMVDTYFKEYDHAPELEKPEQKLIPKCGTLQKQKSLSVVS